MSFSSQVATIYLTHHPFIAGITKLTSETILLLALHTNLGPIHRIKALLTETSIKDNVEHHPVFCEMMVLVTDTVDAAYRLPTYTWVERARWIKYEESVEESGRRWSKPHITLLHMPAIMQLRNCFEKGTTLLHAGAVNYAEIIGKKNHQSL